MMLAGYGKVEITPPLGVELAGYGYYLERRAERVEDPLFARTAAFIQDEQTYLIVSCDCLGLSKTIVNRVEEALSREENIPADHVMIVSIHTHTGPAMKYHEGCGTVSPEYVETVPGKILQACREALADACEVTNMDFLQSTISHPWAYNRACKENPVDDQNRFFIINRLNATPMALASYACHAVCRGAVRAVSADYPGRVCQKLDAKGYCSMYMNGLCGDIDPIRCAVSDRPARLESFANAVCEGLNGSCQALPLTVKGGQVTSEVRLLQVTEEDIHRIADHANEQETNPPGGGRVARVWEKEMIAARAWEKEEEAFPVRYLVLGGVLIAALPFEGYTKTGMLIREAVGDGRTLTLGCAGEMLGYLPTEDDIDRRSYASLDASFLYKRLPSRRGEAERLGRDIGAKLAKARKGEQP